MTTSPLYRGAGRARDYHMSQARQCMERFQVTLDAVWVDMARVHVATARTFNRHAWRAKGRK